MVIGVLVTYGLTPGDKHKLGDLVLSAGPDTLVSLGFPATMIGELLLSVSTDIPLSSSDTVGSSLNFIWKRTCLLELHVNVSLGRKCGKTTVYNKRTFT